MAKNEFCNENGIFSDKSNRPFFFFFFFLQNKLHVFVARQFTVAWLQQHMSLKT